MNSFIKKQTIDADAAYQRLAITRRTLADYQAAINATNTADLVGEIKYLYDSLQQTMRLICLQEQKLINQGE